VTCRGNEGREIFRDDEDRRAFLDRVQRSLEIYGVRVHYYVLMGNHFHLVVQTPKANLSEFMRHLNVSYTGYYNRRHRRVGHLFQGRFKAIVVEADSYLLELSRYVHLNPVRVGAVKRNSLREQLEYLGRYRWSSLGGYLKRDQGVSWVVYGAVLGYVGGSREKYREFVEEGLSRGYVTPWEELRGQVLLGKEGFWERVKGKWSNKRARSREQPSLRILERMDPGTVLRRVAEYFKLRPEELRKKRSHFRDQRGMVMEMLHRYSGLRQEEIGSYLGGIDYTSVSHERSRIRDRLKDNATVKRWLRELEELLFS
jgi:REP element-mobilizing transposase RayT